MNKDFELKILGVNSALPAHGRNPTAQYLRIDSDHFLIDAGEGLQKSLGQYKIPRQKVLNIFISHLHGDHYFGLPGLLNSYVLQGREEELNIYSPSGLKEIIDAIFKQGGAQPSYPLVFHELNNLELECICETSNCRISAFPLEHRVPCYGFIFEERITRRNLNPKMLQKYAVPKTWRSQIQIGADYVTKQGQVIPNELFCLPKSNPRSYAFCTDTKYLPELVSTIRGVDLLYHEATFEHALLKKAEDSFHTTSRQAAQLAELARVKYLILGHFSSRYRSMDALLKEAQEIFSETYIGSEGKSYLIPKEEDDEDLLII